MILTGNEIISRHQGGELFIEPFSAEQVNPNSYDLRLGSTLLSYRETIIDVKSPAAYELVQIPPKGIVLEKDKFYLGSSQEIVGSTHFVPILHAKSGIARLGLFVHITADLIDIGSMGQITFQLLPTMNIRVFSGMRIAQMSFWQTKGVIKLYQGKYQNSSGPQPSRIYESWQPNEGDR